MSQPEVFEPDFSSVRLANGTFVKFTRMEKRLLEVLSTSAGRVLSRSYLLDTITEQGSEKSDRNIDFLINRLRAKLGDSAKDPKFIETRYGEGYVWIFTGTDATLGSNDAFVVIGPLRGVAALGDRETNGRALVSFLQADFGTQIPEGEAVLVAHDMAHDPVNAAPTRKIDVQLSFFQDGVRVECVVSARRLPDGHTVFVCRFPIEAGPGGYHDLSAKSRDMTHSIMASYWKGIAQKNTYEAPLPVAMQQASELPNNSSSWAIADRRLRHLLEQEPDDPALQMMWATHLHSKYVLNGYELFSKGTDTCALDEAEIETSVLTALDYAQSKPELAVMAAKLLYFVDKGYRDLALDLAEQAHTSTTAMASSLAIVGQLYAFTGDMDAAENYLLQAEQLCTPKSDFHVYTLTLLCQAYKAADKKRCLATTLDRLHKVRPATILIYEPLFGDAAQPSLRAKAATMFLSRKRAVGLLKFVTYLSARLFEAPEHQQNSLLTPVNLVVRRFGPDIVPNETARLLPQFPLSSLVNE